MTYQTHLMHDHSDLLIEAALNEDIGPGDVTSRYFVPEGRVVRAFIAAREDGVVSGISLAARVFQRVDPALDIEVLIHDGSNVCRGALLLRVEGRARSILTAERTALNFAQRLSGVATLTARYVEAIRGTQARILDTRKTTPGFRTLEKQAVVHGGGTNHRMGLYDRAMVKDNHLVSVEGIPELKLAIGRLAAEHPEVEVEVEADTLPQVQTFLDVPGIDHILLDNMTPAQLKAAVEMRGNTTRPLLEASGGVNLATVREIAETGVDFISVGALTHSAPSLDLGMDFSHPADA